MYMYTGDADVLYNKFIVSGSYTDTPRLTYPNDNEYCAVARKASTFWEVYGCLEKRQVVCQGGLTLEIYTLISLMSLI